MAGRRQSAQCTSRTVPLATRLGRTRAFVAAILAPFDYRQLT